MKALVINLDSEVRRMDFQKEQLLRLGIEFQRLPAIRLSADDALFKRYYKTWERTLRVSEVACFFSHKAAWESVLIADEPMLILEDDAVLTGNVSCALEELSNLSDADYVNLELRGLSKRLLANEASHQFCDSFLFKLFQGRSGAAGYVLWPSGARKLLDKAKNGHIGLADKYINACYTMVSYQIEPACIIQLDQLHLHGITPPIEVQSTISTDNAKLSDLEKCSMCRIRRVLSQLAVGVNYLRHKKRASKRVVKLSDSFSKD